MTARPAKVNFGFWRKKKTCVAQSKIHHPFVLKPPKLYDIQQGSCGNHAHCLPPNLRKQQPYL